jgi:hypothetical protein
MMVWQERRYEIIKAMMKDDIEFYERVFEVLLRLRSHYESDET